MFWPDSDIFLLKLFGEGQKRALKRAQNIYYAQRTYTVLLVLLSLWRVLQK